MEIAGYQSDIKTTNIFNEDVYHAEKSVAAFGVTTGAIANTYALSLTPKLTKAYEKGLRLQVVFHRPNTGAITLNVDGQGAIAVVKLGAICPEDTQGTTPVIEGATTSTIPIPQQGGVLAKTARLQEREGLLLNAMEEGDIASGIHYIIVFDGERFQIINHIPVCVPLAPIGTPPPTGNELLLNRQELLTIQEDHVDPRISINVGRNRYAAINGNLIVARDIRFKNTDGPGTLSGARIKLPKPLDPSVSDTPGALQSLEGNTYFYSMDKNGVLQVQGELIGANDEINLNFYPYIAKYPLEFDTTIDFSQIAAPVSAAKTAVSSKTTKAKARTKTKPSTKSTPK